MSRQVFEQLVDALVGFLPPERRAFSARVTGQGAKVWFEGDGREHYEVQVLGRKALEAAGRDGASHALEIGFHAEHRDASRNDEVLAQLEDARQAWRRALGRRAESGAFVGHQAAVWRRVSEVWEAPDLDDPGTAVEAAERLAKYILALEPLRRRR